MSNDNTIPDYNNSNIKLSIQFVKSRINELTISLKGNEFYYRKSFVFTSEIARQQSIEIEIQNEIDYYETEIEKIELLNNSNHHNLEIVLPQTLVSVIKKYEYRERETFEKYFRQAIFVFNKKGKYVDSGFIEINDYTNGCKMIKVCNKSKTYIHIYERWEHYKTSFYKTDMVNVTNMVTGNIIKILKNSEVQKYLELNKGCFVGDLEKDEYSEVLLECLNEYNIMNAPPLPLFICNLKNETCECNLFEELEKKQNLSEKKIPVCNCKVVLLKPELTEEQRFLKLQAQTEILDVLNANL